MSEAQENAAKLKLLERKFPGQFEFLRNPSEDQVQRMMERVMSGGDYNLQNSDSGMVDYVGRHLADGREVKMSAWGRDQVAVWVLGPGNGGGTRTATVGKGTGKRRSGRGRFVWFALLVLIAAWIGAKSLPTPNRSGIRSAGSVAPAAGSSIRFAWSHDLAFPWWQPVTRDGKSVWVDKGDVVQIEASAAKSGGYAPAGERPVSFSCDGTGAVAGLRKATAKKMLNRRMDSRAVGLQARTCDRVPPIGDTSTALDVSTAGLLDIRRAGFLFVCPNVPVGGGVRWLCDGSCDLTVAVYTADGVLEPPADVPVPSPVVTVGRDGNVRAEPSTQSRILSKVESGSRLPFLARKGEWYQVRVDTSGVNAWVHQMLVSGCRIDQPESPGRSR